MYIDFHIHAYADEIADRAVQKLKDTANCNVYTNGRIDDTRQKLKEGALITAFYCRLQQSRHSRQP